MSGAGRGDVAIVGMSATFAGAPDVAAYWQNIVDKVDAVTEAPDEWAQSFYDPGSAREDRIYTRKGGFLGELATFNPLEYGIMPSAVDGGEPDQYLALKLASEALKDARYDERPFNREKTGIILGRGTYVNRGYANLMQHGMMVDQTLELLKSIHPELDDDTLAQLRSDLKAKLPPLSAEMCPGLIPNLVTGRIANRLDLMGPNYIVDGACASSLIAVELAVKELLSGRCDMMLSGGVHASTPPQIYMIFCMLDALSRSDIRPFDKSADGVLLGEGVGIVVLKRLADAERDGDRIYAVIKGAGSSSDGKALGMLAPRPEGQILALRRAYEAAGVEPASVELIEAHGTGTSLGDKTEIESLTQVFGERVNGLPRTALGSVKSMISHCIPAAGAAGIIKSALALYHKVLPPTLCDEVNPDIGIERTPFYVNNETRPWIHGRPEAPRRAGVNAFGFGGVNAHTILEEYRGPGAASIAQLNSRWPSELVLFGAESHADLVSAVDRAAIALQQPAGDLAMFARDSAAAATSSGPHRLAIVATDYDDLRGKLEAAKQKLSSNPGLPFKSRNGVYYAPDLEPGQVVFMFPGEGSQYPNMLAELCCNFPLVREWFDFLDAVFAIERECPPSSLIFPPPSSLTDEEQGRLDSGLFDMDVGSEAVFTSSMALFELLREFGVCCDAMLGHSTGENTALVASGTMRIKDRSELSDRLRQFNRIYRELLKNERIPRGALLTVGALQPAAVAAILENLPGPPVHVAMDNCPNQSVLFGDVRSIENAKRALSEKGAICASLPFDRAYHTSLFEDVSDAFVAFYRTLDLQVGHVPVYSCTAMAYFPSSPEAMRLMATQQWARRVRFRESIEHLHDEGFRTFVEVGPSGNLTSFVNDILKDRDHMAVACNNRRRPGLSGLQHLLGRLYVRGLSIDASPLFEQRSLGRPADEAGPKRTAGVQQPLEFTMPMMALSPEMAGKVRTHRPGVTVGAEKSIIARTKIESAGSDACSSPREPVSPARSSEIASHSPDARTAALQSHFGLMQEFLSSQARVMAQLAASSSHPIANNPQAPASINGRPDFQIDNWPMLGEVVSSSPERLICERRLDLQGDRFLRDHTLGGTVSVYDTELLPLAVIPFTFSMEIIGQAASRLVGAGYRVSSMHDLRGYRWLTLDPGHIDLRIEARMQKAPHRDESQRRVSVRVWQTNVQSPPGGLLVFEGDVGLAKNFGPPPAPCALDERKLKPSGLDDNDLYTTGMFHGPLLQGVKHIARWSEEGIEAELEVLPLDGFFGSSRSPSFTTDAGLLDAAGQLVGYWLSEQFGSDFNCFPFRVSSFEQFALSPPPGTRVLCRGQVRFSSDTQIIARFDLIDENARLIARLDGWEDRYFKIPERFYQVRLNPTAAYLSDEFSSLDPEIICRKITSLPEHFLDDGGEIWKRVLAHVVLAPREREEWYALAYSEARKSEWLLGRIAAKDAVRYWLKQTQGLSLAPADVQIETADSGKPYVGAIPVDVRRPDISIAHSGNQVVAAVVSPGQRVGIDIERVDRVRSDDAVRVGFGVTEQHILGRCQLADRERMMLCMWTAKEAAAKVDGSGLEGDPIAWAVTDVNLAAGMARVTHDNRACAISFILGDDYVVAACHEQVGESDGESGHITRTDLGDRSHREKLQSSG